ncbi:precorrin-6y C5,15-methyltransferase (decarboxylating) subunit CbiE [Vibrio sp. TH_r3]|uniref:precorrin-6y C5,15-methyltransferase (decarboxylating) subunit CbiE n=1 Tax=Vibrio sp. TH_r3 TaxID=3082084 RepID=UPI0029535039|nr:precorrin-6y C5,15-methyltransferase (decarboxylating) subunit CbiE [Vibrio sp. TH_r3]MDV7103699.1 precorrin-6y C5,15-methyltransferase (decarboxylating) subunit CbiE [Vibrio sp. TH_r3]
MMTRITIVGVPEDGCLGLTSRAVNAVSNARVVAGHPRHREWFPQFEGLFLDMSLGFSDWMNKVIDESEEGEVVILASGDPLFFGIGTTLLKKMSASDLTFIPSISSAQLAFSRLGLPWNEARFLSCHGRSLTGLTSQLQQGDLFAILTDYKNTPSVLAAHMQRFNQMDWQLSVCEQLGATNERIRSFTVEELVNSDIEFDKLNIVLAQRLTNKKWGGHGQFSSDESFLKRMPQKGLITKLAVRNLALTSLTIQANDTVWDIGSGSGSVAIESAKLAWNGKVYAVECNQECLQSIQENCFAHSTDNVCLIDTKAPDGLADLPDPDAVFIGGSRGQMASILSTAVQRLKNHGRLMISAVTIDTVAEVYQWAKQNQHTLSTQVINVSHTQPLAHYQRFQAENPIYLFTVIKTVQENLS